MAQKKLFDTLKIDPTTKILLRCKDYDKFKSCENYDFMIEDSAEIADFIKMLRLGKKAVASIAGQNYDYLL